MSHTPGPWDADEDGIVFDPRDDHIIASVSERYDPNWMANARLIAAAPDLLAELQDVALMYHAVSPGHDAARLEDCEMETCKQSSAAIAKAKGVTETA